MINLKASPWDKIIHALISFLFALLGGELGAAFIVGWFMSREEHTAERYMHGSWKAYAFIWSWEEREGKPTVSDSYWDFIVSIIGAGLGLVVRRGVGL
jgi:hypothetical protein